LSKLASCGPVSVGRLGSTKANSVLIVDDDPTFCDAVEALVSRAGLEATTVGLGGDALNAVDEERPDVVVVDVALPDMSGYELCRQLRERFGESLPIIFVSGDRTDALDRSAGLLLGADDYVVKPFDPDEFIARVRRAAARSHLRSENGTRQEHLADGFGLTPREVEVLDLLAHGRRQREIAAELVISEKTVSSHIQGILSKLGAHSRAEAIAVAWRNQIVGHSSDVLGHAIPEEAQPVGAA
jgi:DNA-binding NarL/FixJ family response regulator